MYIISQMLNMVRTNMLVKVVAVHDAGGVNLTGTVDVQPLVTQIDGFSNIEPHAVIYGLTYFRLQGGTNAIIICPEVGDIGIAAICDRDSSVVVNTKAQGAPGSHRQHCMSDGIYFGGMLNQVPIRYVAITDAGITINSDSIVTINAPSGAIVNAPTVTVPSGDVIASGISLLNHDHTGVTPGSGTSGGPTG